MDSSRGLRRASTSATRNGRRWKEEHGILYWYSNERL